VSLRTIAVAQVSGYCCPSRGSLREIGASKEDIPALAAAAMADACARGNPREATLDDVVALYIAAF
jgi:lactaldehyde reductase